MHCAAEQIMHRDVLNYPEVGRLLLWLIMERQTLTRMSKEMLRKSLFFQQKDGLAYNNMFRLRGLTWVMEKLP
jgi:hypothetical protein